MDPILENIYRNIEHDDFSQLSREILIFKLEVIRSLIEAHVKNESAQPIA